MSHDITIENDEFNVTYNLGKLFHTHLRDAEGNTGIAALNGKYVDIAADMLGAALDSMHAELQAEYRLGEEDGRLAARRLMERYDAPNGWGTMLQAVIVTGRMLSSCHQAWNETIIEVC